MGLCNFLNCTWVYYIFFAAIGKHHVYLLLVVVRALCIGSMYSVMTSALHEHHQIRLVILDWTKVQAGDIISNSIMDALDVHDFGTMLHK